MKPRRRALVTLLTGEKADLDLARRRVGYDTLVLLVHPGTEALAEQARAAEHEAAGDEACRIVHVPGADIEALMVQLRALLDDLRDNTVTINAAGGTPGLAIALMLVAFERGAETWYYQAGHATRLPILDQVKLGDRFDADERRVLRHLGTGGTTSTATAEMTLLPRTSVERAFRSLRQKGLVTLAAHDGRAHAALTEQGVYFHEHLAKA